MDRSMSVLLHFSRTGVLSVMITSLYNNNQWERLATLGVVMMTITAVMTVVAFKATAVKRIGF